MYSKYPINRDNRLNTKKKLYKFATCKIEFRKIAPFRHPTLDNRQVSYSATEHQSYFHERQTDRRTDRHR